jgi:CHASE1-domain containing sensor protein
MTGAVVVVAVVVFLAGLLVGVVAAGAAMLRREDRRYTLAVDAPDQLSRVARRLVGVSRRETQPPRDHVR